MLNLENTEEVLNAWGADIVKFAKINIGDKNRPRKSTLTGKTYRKKIDNTGNLRNSLDHNFKVNKNSFTVAVTGADYALYVNDGRKKGKGIPLPPLITWAKKIRFRENGKNVKNTLERRKAFAGFVSWKAKKYGIAPTDYLTDAIKMASKKYEEELVSALFKDTEATVGTILRGLENGSRNNSN